MQLPAVCPHCGLVFPSMIGGSGRLRVQTVGQPCPRCGRDARVLDGFFDLLEDTVRLLDGPEFTKEILDEIFGAIEELKTNPTAREEVVSRIVAKSPALGALLWKLLVDSATIAGAVFSGLAYLHALEGSRHATSIEERMLIISERISANLEKADDTGYRTPPMALPPQEVKPYDNRHKRRVDRAIKRKSKGR